LARHATVLMWSTADRRRVFITSAEDDATYMIDAEHLDVTGRWPVGDFAGTVSADGTLFALGSQEGDVRVLDLKSGHVRTFGRHDASVLRMRFTADGRTLVTSGADGTVMVWDVDHGEAREVLSGHARGLVWGMAVSPDGRTAYSVGEDQRAFVWDITGDRSLVRPFVAERPFDLGDSEELLPRGLAVSPDGRTLAIGHSDGTVDLLDARTLARRDGVRALRGFVGAIAFSPDGRLLAAAGERGELTLWDTRSLRPMGRLEGQLNISQALAFSPDGALLAAAELSVSSPDRTLSKPGTVRVWDVRRRTPTRVRFVADSPSIAFSPNGRLLAAAGNDRPTEVRDPRSGRLIASLPTPGDGRSVAFSPDGRLIATGHFDGTARLWSTATWKPVGQPFNAHDGQRVLWMGFTAGASMLATAGQDGTTTLFDVATQSPVGPHVTVEPDSYLAAALAPDGRTLFVVSDQRAALRLNLSPAAWNRHACRIAGRELTPPEWADALPGEPYRAICRAR
jgi:WD40 repeat protein